MGGKTWSSLEEQYFWGTAIKQSEKALGTDRTNNLKTWRELAEEMQAALGEDAKREYGAQMLFEHYFQNAVKENFSPNARRLANEYIDKFESIHGFKPSAHLTRGHGTNASTSSASGATSSNTPRGASPTGSACSSGKSTGSGQQKQKSPESSSVALADAQAGPSAPGLSVPGPSDSPVSEQDAAIEDGEEASGAQSSGSHPTGSGANPQVGGIPTPQPQQGPVIYDVAFYDSDEEGYEEMWEDENYHGTAEDDPYYHAPLGELPTESNTEYDRGPDHRLARLQTEIQRSTEAMDWLRDGHGLFPNRENVDPVFLANQPRVPPSRDSRAKYEGATGWQGTPHSRPSLSTEYDSLTARRPDNAQGYRANAARFDGDSALLRAAVGLPNPNFPNTQLRPAHLGPGLPNPMGWYLQGTVAPGAGSARQGSAGYVGTQAAPNLPPVAQAHSLQAIPMRLPIRPAAGDSGTSNRGNKATSEPEDGEDED